MTNKITVLDTSGQEQAINNFDESSYTDELNGLGRFRIVIGSYTDLDQTKYVEFKKDNGAALGNNRQGIVSFYREGSIDFKGVLEKIHYDEQGRMVLSGRGTGCFMDYMSITTGNDRASESMDTRIIFFITGTTSDTDELSTEYPITVAAGDIDDFANLPAKNFAAYPISRAVLETVVDDANHDFYMSYASTATGDDTLKVASFASPTDYGIVVVGVDVEGYRRTVDTTKVINNVPVFGRNNAGVQVQGSGTDATSKTTYGKRMPNFAYVNKRLETNANANTVGSNIISNYDDPVQPVSFRVKAPDRSFALGGTVTVSWSQLSINDAFKIIGATRTWTGRGAERLDWHLIQTGKHYSTIQQLGNVATDRLMTNSTNSDGGTLSSGTTAEKHIQDDSLTTTSDNASEVEAANNSSSLDNLSHNVWTEIMTIISPTAAIIGLSFIHVALGCIEPLTGETIEVMVSEDASGTPDVRSNIATVELRLFNHFHDIGASGTHDHSGEVTAGGDHNHGGATPFAWQVQTSVLLVSDFDWNGADMHLWVRRTDSASTATRIYSFNANAVCTGLHNHGGAPGGSVDGADNTGVVGDELDVTGSVDGGAVL